MSLVFADHLHTVENIGFCALQLRLMTKTQLLSLYIMSKTVLEEMHWLNLSQSPHRKSNQVTQAGDEKTQELCAELEFNVC